MVEQTADSCALMTRGCQTVAELTAMRVNMATIFRPSHLCMCLCTNPTSLTQNPQLKQEQCTLLEPFSAQAKIRQQAEIKDNGWLESRLLMFISYWLKRWTHQCHFPPAFSQKTIASAVHHLMLHTPLSVCVCVRECVQECVCVRVCAFLHCPKHSHCQVRMQIHRTETPPKWFNGEMGLKQLNNANPKKSNQMKLKKKKLK